MTALGEVRRDGSTAEFLDGTARGVFLLRKCRQCDSLGGPQEMVCGSCGGADSDAYAASGRASVVSWTVVHGRDADGRSGPQTVLAIGQLDEGPWWWTQVLDAGPGDLRTGAALTIDFERAPNGEMLPVFRLG